MPNREFQVVSSMSRPLRLVTVNVNTPVYTPKRLQLFVIAFIGPHRFDVISVPGALFTTIGRQAQCSSEPAPVVQKTSDIGIA